MFSFDPSQLISIASSWVSIATAFLSLVPLVVVTIRKIYKSRSLKQKFLNKRTIIDYSIAIIISIIIISIPTTLIYLGIPQAKSVSHSERALQDYVDATQRPPNINDPLKDNSQGEGWLEGVTDSGEFSFHGNAYHIRAFQQSSYAYGYESQLKVDNVAFQVRVTTLAGNPGVAGVVIGYGSNLMYVFSIDPDQNYEVDRIDTGSFSGQSSTRLVKDKTLLIHGGYNHSNLIEVLMRDSKLELSINSVYLTTIPIMDTSGEVGFVVGDNIGPFEAMFQDFKLWT